MAPQPHRLTSSDETPLTEVCIDQLEFLLEHRQICHNEAGHCEQCMRLYLVIAECADVLMRPFRAMENSRR